VEALVVGVDFAEDGIRLAAVRTSDVGPSVAATHRYRWPAGTWAAGRVLQPTVVTAGLAGAFGDASAPTDRVILGIVEEAVYRAITIPRMNDAELTAQIGWEAAQHLSTPVEAAVLEYRVVDPATSESTMRVVLSGFPREALDTHVAAAREAGLRPIAAELETEALRRLACASDPLDAGARALVRAGATSARLVLVVDGEVAASALVTGNDPAALADGIVRRLGFFAKSQGVSPARIDVGGPTAASLVAVLRPRVEPELGRWTQGRLRCECDPTDLHEYVTAIGLALPGPDTRAVGAEPPTPSLWSRVRGLLAR
jgi:hypothetical protein